MWFSAPSLSNFGYLKDNGYLQQFANSLVLGIGTMVSVVVLTSLAAYPLSRYTSHGH